MKKIHKAKTAGLFTGSDTFLAIVSGFLLIFGFLRGNYIAMVIGAFLVPMWAVKREIFVDEVGVHSYRKFLTWENDLVMTFKEMIGIFHEEPKNGKVKLYFRNEERAKRVEFSLEDAREVIALAKKAKRGLTVPKI